MFYKVFRLTKATSFGASSLYLVYCLLLEPFFYFSLLFPCSSHLKLTAIFVTIYKVRQDSCLNNLWKKVSHNVQLDLVKLFRFYDELINELLFQT